MGFPIDSKFRNGSDSGTTLYPNAAMLSKYTYRGVVIQRNYYVSEDLCGCGVSRACQFHAFRLYLQVKYAAFTLGKRETPMERLRFSYLIFAMHPL